MTSAVLIADDDRTIRQLVSETLNDRELRIVHDGKTAWDALQAPDAPSIAVLDWSMPGLVGPEVCRRVRQRPATIAPYLIILTSHNRPENIVEALSAGADDYMFKPFHPAELRARVAAGERVVALQRALADRVHALETALSQVKRLEGLLPICAYCKRIRDSRDYWHQVEAYIMEHSDAAFTHGICPTCFDKVIAEQEGR